MLPFLMDILLMGKNNEFLILLLWLLKLLFKLLFMLLFPMLFILLFTLFILLPLFVLIDKLDIFRFVLLCED